MKCFLILVCLFLPLPALASVVPPKQQLAAVAYFKDGKQSGCGLRAVGETPDSLWIDVLVSVFLRQSGNLSGMFKVVARKVNRVDGAPLLQDGRVGITSLGNIRKAWIKTDTGVQFLPGKGSGGPHNDGYMAPVRFDDAMALLIAMPQANFRVGISQGEGEAEEVFEFDRRITQEEAEKLSSCVKNLREAREGKSL